MIVRLLGTAACEGIPSLFCNCELCRRARELGGKEIRTRSQVLVNDDLAIDFPADTYTHMVRSGIDASAISTVLVTHSHFDHFYGGELNNRSDHMAYDMTAPHVSFYANQTVVDMMRGTERYPFRKYADFTAVRPYRTFTAGRYTVTPLPAVHTFPEQSLLYLLQSDDGTLLYGTDTYCFDDGILPYLAEHGIRLDIACLDSTRGFAEPDVGRHMNAEQVVTLTDRMRRLGILHERSIVVATHFSHNGKGLYADLERFYAPHNILVAYDGLRLQV